MGWVINATLQPFYTGERAPLHIVKKAVWTSEPVLTGAENVSPTDPISEEFGPKPVAIRNRYLILLGKGCVKA